jgi:hypothetical protein
MLYITDQLKGIEDGPRPFSDACSNRITAIKKHPLEMIYDNVTESSEKSEESSKDNDIIESITAAVINVKAAEPFQDVLSMVSVAAQQHLRS